MGQRQGDCSICGDYGDLTKEHLPLRSAHNKGDYDVYSINPYKTKGTVVWRKQKRQGGHFAYVLCASCNSITGHRYGAAYTHFADCCRFQSAPVSSRIATVYSAGFHPLRTIKQVLAMMLASSPPTLQPLSDFWDPWGRRPEIDFDGSMPHSYRAALRNLVLDRDAKGIPDPLRLYLYMVVNGAGRSSGIGIRSTTGGVGTLVSQEFAWQPLGWVLVYDGQPDHPMLDVNEWAQFGYDDEVSMGLNVPYYHIESSYPLDFRTADQLDTPDVTATSLVE